MKVPDSLEDFGLCPRETNCWTFTDDELFELLMSAYTKGKLDEVDIEKDEQPITEHSDEHKLYENLDEFRYEECAYCGSFICSDPDDAAAEGCHKLKEAHFKRGR